MNVKGLEGLVGVNVVHVQPAGYDAISGPQLETEGGENMGSLLLTYPKN